MIRRLCIAVVVLALAACVKQPESAAGPAEAPAAKTAQNAPGPSAGEPTPRAKPLTGRVFKMPANGAMPDPRALKAAIQRGNALPPGVEEVGKDAMANDEAKAKDKEKSKQQAVETVTRIYSMIAGKPMDVLEVTEASGLWRVSFQTRGVKEAPSTVHVSMDGKLAFEGGFELQDRYDKLQIGFNFANCLHVRGVRIIGDSRDKATQAQLKEIGSFAGKVLVDCGREKDGCKKLMAKLKIAKLPVIEQASDRFTGPRPRSFLETLSGCK